MCNEVDGLEKDGGREIEVGGVGVGGLGSGELGLGDLGRGWGVKVGGVGSGGVGVGVPDCDTNPLPPTITIFQAADPYSTHFASNCLGVKSSSRQVAHVQFVCIKSSTSNCPVPIRLFHPNFNWQSFCMRTLTGCKQVHQVLKDRKQN